MDEGLYSFLKIRLGTNTWKVKKCRCCGITKKCQKSTHRNRWECWECIRGWCLCAWGIEAIKDEVDDRSGTENDQCVFPQQIKEEKNED